MEWLGFARRPIYSNAVWFGPILGAFLFSVALFLAFATIITLVLFAFALFGAGPYEGDKSGEAIRNIGLVLAALLGAPLLLWRSIVNAQQVEIASEVLFNDKMNSAAQGLTTRRETTRVVRQGDVDVVLKEIEDDLVARAAAIDRLEGLVNEQEAAAPRVVRMLAAYIRGNFRCENVLPTEDLKLRKVPSMDLQKAVDAIGRVHRIAVDVDSTHWRLDLKECDFDGVNFSTGFFRAADFSGCRFEATMFGEAVFEGCLFSGSLMNFSEFRKASLRGARLDRITLNKVQGGWAGSLNQADLTGATFIASDISALSYLGRPQVIAKTFATKDTQVAPEVRSKMRDIGDFDHAHLCRSLKKEENLTDEERVLVSKLEASGFQHWSPYDSADGATGSLLKEFYQELGLLEWPFWNR
ncbi:MAG: hypothetical protein CVT79_12260 [Alphaproteobacteria bacterium HGW-Alphaproteobacteria-18]|nr:MAG: hypothetical protein CVT79_12260 [Alphaproteobacteria bacterium HGW-Alphaproteobacteria-18]